MTVEEADSKFPTGKGARDGGRGEREGGVRRQRARREDRPLAKGAYHVAKETSSVKFISPPSPPSEEKQARHGAGGGYRSPGLQPPPWGHHGHHAASGPRVPGPNPQTQHDADAVTPPAAGLGSAQRPGRSVAAGPARARRRPPCWPLSARREDARALVARERVAADAADPMVTLSTAGAPTLESSRNNHLMIKYLECSKFL